MSSGGIHMYESKRQPERQGPRQFELSAVTDAAAKRMGFVDLEAFKVFQKNLEAKESNLAPYLLQEACNVAWSLEAQDTAAVTESVHSIRYVVDQVMKGDTPEKRAA